MRRGVAKKSFYITLLILLVNGWIYAGFVRLYLFPSLAQFLYFIPFGLVVVICIYSVFTSSVSIEKRLYLLFFLYLAVFFQTIHIYRGNTNLQIAVYGLLLYSFPIFLFLGLPKYNGTLISKLLEKQLLYAIFPNLILSFLQTYVPNSRFAPTLDGTHHLDSTSGYIRAFGTFSSTTGFSYYLIAVTCVLIINSPKKLSKIFFFQCIAIVTMYAMSGSRAAIFSGLVILSLSILTLKNQTAVISTWVPAILLSIIPIFFLFQIYLLGPISALIERLGEASRQENSFLRIWTNLTAFIGNVSSSSLGSGFGSFSTGSVGYADTQKWIEDDLSRTLAECGTLLGLLLILFRWILAFRLLQISIKEFKNNSNDILFLTVAVAPNLISGQIFGQGSIAVGSWITVFLIILRSKELRIESSSRSDQI